MMNPIRRVLYIIARFKRYYKETNDGYSNFHWLSFKDLFKNRFLLSSESLSKTFMLIGIFVPSVCSNKIVRHFFVKFVLLARSFVIVLNSWMKNVRNIDIYIYILSRILGFLLVIDKFINRWESATEVMQCNADVAIEAAMSNSFEYMIKNKKP